MSQTPPPALNQGQREAADKFFDFLMSTDPFFVVSGPAGTGKTFLMNYLSNKGLQTYHDACTLIGIKPEYTETHFTATTNKAAEVLEESIGKPVQTIHSFLCLKVQENWKTGKTDITRTANWRVRRNLVLFIDECSMIDSGLFKELLESFVSCKIVFVGDHAQMAPVGEDLSPIYQSVSMNNFTCLFEPVRNAGQPALMALCDQLRETVETGVFRPMRPVPGVIDYLDNNQMPQELTAVFTDPNPPARVLCYTNSRTMEYNGFIRSEVRGLPPEISVGDTMVVASTYQQGSLNLPVEREVTVTQVSDVLEDHNWAEVLGNHPIYYRLVSFSQYPSQNGEPYIRVALDRPLVDQAIKAYGKRKDFSSYFNLKGMYLDLRDKAACTVYKSQGSSYDTVFIDLGNIGTSYDAKQVARMLYVAVSRARHRICFYGQLPGRYYNSQGPLWITENGSQESSPSSPDENVSVLKTGSRP